MTSTRRPYRTDQPVRVTLYLGRKAKNKLYGLATRHDLSMSRMTEALIEEELLRLAEEPKTTHTEDGEAGPEAAGL